MRHTLIIAALGVAAGYFFVLMFAFALFWPVKTLEIKSDLPVAVETKVLHPGDTLGYKLSYCKYRDSTAIVHRELIDGQVITLQDIDGQLPLGCNTTEVRTVVIPETLVPGKYKLSVSIDYAINPIHDAFFGKQRTRYTTEYFTVVAKIMPATAVINGVPTKVYIKPADPVPTPSGTETITVINNNTPSSQASPTQAAATPAPTPSVGGDVIQAVSGLLH